MTKLSILDLSVYVWNVIRAGHRNPLLGFFMEGLSQYRELEFSFDHRITV